MPERKNEAAWIEKSQRWQIKVQKDGERKAFYSTKPGKKGKIEAEKKADAWMDSGLHSASVRFGKIWDAYVEREEEIRGVTSTVYHHEEYLGRLYLKPRLEHKKLSSITPQDWQDCIDYAYKERGLTQKTLKNLRGVITSFWKYLRRAQILFIQPIDPLTIPTKAKVLERTIVQPDALQQVFGTDTYTVRGHSYQPHYLYAWRFILATGLRPGEMIGLRKEDICETTVSLSRSINIHGEETAGKNKRARRSFMLPPKALEILEEQQAYLDKMGIASAWVFPATDGGQASERAIYKAWRSYCDRVGIPKTSLYELRHTFVSINYAVPDALLKSMVGHGPSMNTRGQYGHEVDGQKYITAELIDKSLSLALQKQ